MSVNKPIFSAFHSVAWQERKADAPVTAHALRPAMIQRWMRVLLSFFLSSGT
jgi:hypothetical protein